MKDKSMTNGTGVKRLYISFEAEAAERDYELRENNLKNIMEEVDRKCAPTDVIMVLRQVCPEISDIGKKNRKSKSISFRSNR